MILSLQIAGAVRIGPLAASVPATMVAYLTSIGKASFYARFLAGQGMTANSDGSGGSPADGAAVGCWSAYQANNFTAKFIQATSASRPAYGASRNGKPGIYGNASSWFLTLNSTTANNQSFTLLASGWTASENATWISQNNNALRAVTGTTAMDGLFVGGAVSNAAPQATRKSLSGAGNAVRLGVTTTSAAHYHQTMNLFRRSTGVEYSSSTLHELWIVPPLSADEIAQALGYLI